MAGNIEWNSDLELKGKAIIYTVPNGTGTVLIYNPTDKTVSTRTNTELISDLSLVTTNTFQTITADKVFKKITTTDWVIPKYLAFPDASGALPNYIGFYMWDSQWQVNWRDSNNEFVYNILTIDGLSKDASFAGTVYSKGFELANVNHTHKTLTSAFTSVVNLNDLMQDGVFRYDTVVDSGSTNMFPAYDTANSVLSISSYPGYNTQLGFNTRGEIYTRSKGNAGNTITDWKKILTSVDFDGKVGARNLILNSKNFGFYVSDAARSNNSVLGEVTITDGNGFWNAYGSAPIAEYTPGSKLLYQVEIMHNNSTAIDMTFYFYNNGDSQIFTQVIQPNVWTKVTRVSSPNYTTSVLMGFGATNTDIGTKIYYKNKQVEEGITVSTYRPAYEDFASSLSLTDYWKIYNIGNYKGIDSDKPFSVLNGNFPQRVYSGGLMVSDYFDGDAPLLPTYGIYSKGDIRTSGQVITDRLSSLTLSGNQIFNTNSSQLYIGNPLISQVYFESGDSNLTHYRAGYGNGIIWDAHNLPNPVTQTQLNNKVDKSGDTMTGALNINSSSTIGKWKGYDNNSNYLIWRNYPDTKDIGYIGADGNSAVGGGIGDGFGIVAPSGELKLVSEADLKLISSANIRAEARLVTNYQGSTSGQNLGSGGIGNSLELRNYDAYGTNFWTNDNSWGFIQQQRFDGNPVAYRLVLQPLGGELFYRNNEVATVNQIPDVSNFTTYSFLAQNYALRDGSNATDTWVNSAYGLTNNPAIPGKIKNSLGDVYLNAATYGTVMGMINTANIVDGCPTNHWYHRIKMLHNNSAGYYTEIAVQMTAGNSMWYKRFENGTNYGWVQVWDKQNLPQSSINSWNYMATYGLQLNYQFTVNTGTGLMIADDYFGAESGLVDGNYENYVSGKSSVSPYYKYGSGLYDNWDGINYHYEAKLISIGREVGNNEDKVQLAGNLSVDTVDINDNPMQLILNPLYNTDGNVRDSRNAHIYITTRGTVILPQIPILGQRIEIFNWSDNDIEVQHDNVGTMFYIPGFGKITGIAGLKGFIFDKEPILAQEYSI